MLQQGDGELIAAGAPKLKEIDNHHAAAQILNLQSRGVYPLGDFLLGRLAIGFLGLAG